MRVKKLVYGNIGAGEGQGWRMLAQDPTINESDSKWICDLCASAYTSAQRGSSDRIFWCFRSGRKLLAGYGSREGKDAFGRPAGWVFYCCLCRPYRDSFSNVIPLLRILFDGCVHWLDARESMEPSTYDRESLQVAIHNAGHASKDFWRDLEPIASYAVSLLKRRRHVRSLAFPMQCLNDDFALGISAEDVNKPAGSTQNEYLDSLYLVYRIGMPAALLVSVTAAVLLFKTNGTLRSERDRFKDDASVFQSKYEDEASEARRLKSTKSALDDTIDKNSQTIKDLYGRFSAGEVEIRSLKSSISRLEQGVGSELKRQRDEALMKLSEMKTAVNRFRSIVKEEVDSCEKALKDLIAVENAYKELLDIAETEDPPVNTNEVNVSRPPAPTTPYLEPRVDRQ